MRTRKKCGLAFSCHHEDSLKCKWDQGKLLDPHCWSLALLLAVAASKNFNSGVCQ